MAHLNVEQFDALNASNPNAAAEIFVLRGEVERLKTALSHSVDRWIPISERLPREGEEVLISGERGVTVGRRGMGIGSNEGRVWHDATQHCGDEGWPDNITVTHWMPLPAAPEAP